LYNLFGLYHLSNKKGERRERPGRYVKQNDSDDCLSKRGLELKLGKYLLLHTHDLNYSTMEVNSCITFRIINTFRRNQQYQNPLTYRPCEPNSSRNGK
jgi:hypothetical protein